MATTVTDAPERDRYELSVDGEVVGFAAYQRRDDRLVLTHTEVDEDREGQGLGSRLATGVLDDLRQRGLRAVVRCPFIGAYVERHPEYADVVDDR